MYDFFMNLYVKECEKIPHSFMWFPDNATKFMFSLYYVIVSNKGCLPVI